LYKNVLLNHSVLNIKNISSEVGKFRSIADIEKGLIDIGTSNEVKL
jgi:hypothetical protein